MLPTHVGYEFRTVGNSADGHAHDGTATVPAGGTVRVTKKDVMGGMNGEVDIDRATLFITAGSNLYVGPHPVEFDGGANHLSNASMQAAMLLAVSGGFDVVNRSDKDAAFTFRCRVRRRKG